MKICEKLAARSQNAGACAPVLIAFIGDSVTHGCFEVYMDHKNEIGVVYEPDQGYPYRLKRRLDALYPEASAYLMRAYPVKRRRTARGGSSATYLRAGRIWWSLPLR